MNNINVESLFHLAPRKALPKEEKVKVKTEEKSQVKKVEKEKECEKRTIGTPKAIKTAKKYVITISAQVEFSK